MGGGVLVCHRHISPLTLQKAHCVVTYIVHISFHHVLDFYLNHLRYLKHHGHLEQTSANSRGLRWGLLALASMFNRKFGSPCINSSDMWGRVVIMSCRQDGTMKLLVRPVGFVSKHPQVTVQVLMNKKRLTQMFCKGQYFNLVNDIHPDAQWWPQVFSSIQMPNDDHKYFPPPIWKHHRAFPSLVPLCKQA